MNDKTLKSYLIKWPGPEINIIGPMLNKNLTSLAEPVVAVDRGTEFADVRSFSVGDGDSTLSLLMHPLPKAKNYSDLAFVLSHLPPQYLSVNLFGFLGGRRDHELINFAEVHGWLSGKLHENTKTKVSGAIPHSVNFESQVHAYSTGSWDFHHHGLFSLFSFGQCSLRIIGKCEYRQEALTPLTPLSSHGLSNRGFGDIQIQCEGVVFLFLN